MTDSNGAEAPTTGEGVKQKDAYVVLGIERTATVEEIKKAFRKKSLKWHPDRNRQNIEEATKMMAEINAAHKILSDEKLKEIYDAHGYEGVQEYETYGTVLTGLPCCLKYCCILVFVGSCCCCGLPWWISCCTRGPEDEGDAEFDAVTEEPEATVLPVEAASDEQLNNP